MNTNLIYSDESYRIRGACYEVYKEKGCGYTEPVYQECLEMEMALMGIPCDPQRNMPLTYKGRKLTHTFIPDLICYGKIILELKAVTELIDVHRAQLINYLHACDLKLGLLINFGAGGGIQIERFAL